MIVISCLYKILCLGSYLVKIDNFLFLQLEAWFEKTLKEKKGWDIKKMGEDGACLFRAVG